MTPNPLINIIGVVMTVYACIGAAYMHMPHWKIWQCSAEIRR